PLEYRFWGTYSFHCFIKDYEQQTNEEIPSLMYHASKESRLFCQHRYNLSRTHLKRTILALPESNVIHAGYGIYAVIEVDLDGGYKAFYFVLFRAFREKKKLRVHLSISYSIFVKLKCKSV
uniref:stationary phase growth adaptation protein n=1 Tax=Escherichia coli TaxID=562 RepID=UPI0025527E67